VIELRRFMDTGSATLGALFLDGAPICFTLEDTATRQDSETFCIPPGLYTLRRVISPKFGETFTVLGVPGHDLLRVHWGNTHADTRGCPLVGMGIELINGARLTASKAAFELFLRVMRDLDETKIRIETCY
jgi:hypothetical protein